MGRLKSRAAGHRQLYLKQMTTFLFDNQVPSTSFSADQNKEFIIQDFVFAEAAIGWWQNEEIAGKGGTVIHVMSREHGAFFFLPPRDFKLRSRRCVLRQPPTDNEKPPAKAQAKKDETFNFESQKRLRGKLRRKPGGVKFAANIQREVS